MLTSGLKKKNLPLSSDAYVEVNTMKTQFYLPAGKMTTAMTKPAPAYGGLYTKNKGKKRK
jgi:hypothetical protein